MNINMTCRITLNIFFTSKIQFVLKQNFVPIIQIMQMDNINFFFKKKTSLIPSARKTC
jgi:hypothetical protein